MTGANSTLTDTKGSPDRRLPVIGIVGGIGAGKSFVAGLFGELGAGVICSDALVGEVYNDPAVRATIRRWWGEAMLNIDGGVDKRAIARVVFADPAERRRLEELIHPLVNSRRSELMRRYRLEPDRPAVVWDTPLLLESGLAAECDAIVFVEASPATRSARVATRGWDPAELAKREKFQLPLDKKKEAAHYVIRNEADASETRRQTLEAYRRILTSFGKSP